MAYLIKKLQNPYIKILLAPLSVIIFGIVIGMKESTTNHWLSFLLLYLIVLFSELIKHFFDLSKNRSKPADMPILILFEVLLMVATGLFIMRHYWPINIMVVLYLVYLHLQYFPYNLSKSVYALAFNVFFQGFILNIVAYFTQTQQLNFDLIKILIPLSLVCFAINFEDILLHYSLMSRRPLSNIIKKYHAIFALAIILLSVLLGVYFSMPTHSFYIVQLIFGVISFIISIPLLAPTRTRHEIQNKLNFFGSIQLIIAVLYSLSYLF